MLEILAHASGIQSLTRESSRVLGDLTDLEPLLRDYVESWHEELAWCKASGLPVSDPVGTILEENNAANHGLSQFLTPPEVVRMTNSMMLENTEVQPGKPFTGLDPCCGTGRFALDAVVHHDHIRMFNVDIDLWMVRAAILNFRYAGRFTTAIEQPKPVLDRGSVLADESAAELRRQGFTLPRSSASERIIVIGGRARVICADSLIIDLLAPENWRYSWQWDPPPWRETMKVDGFDGTYEEWRKSHSSNEVERRLHELPSPRAAPEFESLIDDGIHPDVARAVSMKRSRL